MSPAALRERPIEEIDAVLTAAAPRFGIVRVAEVTALDEVGVRTVTVTRCDPIGVSVSVASGTGDDVRAARVAALAEALERHCAEPRGRLAIVTARRDELDGAAVELSRLIVPPDADLDAPIDWCRGATIAGSPCWVPANAVVFPYQPTVGATPLFDGHTHGLAVGATRDEAIVHGLLECFERDAYSRAVALATAGRGDEVPVLDLEHCAATSPLLARLRRAGLQVLARDLTCDSDVPVVLCTVSDGALVHMGVVAHAAPAQALARALREAAQSRLVDLQGAREDLPSRDEAPPHPWFTDAAEAPRRVVDEGTRAADVADALAWLRARAAALDVEPIVVDLSPPWISLAVVRVVTPGLEVWAFDPSRIGTRAASWLAAA